MVRPTGNAYRRPEPHGGPEPQSPRKSSPARSKRERRRRPLTGSPRSLRQRWRRRAGPKRPRRRWRTLQRRGRHRRTTRGEERSLRRRVLLAAVLLAAGVVAAVNIRQDVGVTPSAVAADVIFALGNDYTVINAAGFATISLGTTATSATFAVSGVPGAADLVLGDVLKLTNQDGSQGYNVTMSRSATLDAAIGEFTLHLLNSSDVEQVAWNAKTAASSSVFSLPANTTYDITVDFTTADGTSLGALATFTIQFDLGPT